MSPLTQAAGSGKHFEIGRRSTFKREWTSGLEVEPHGGVVQVEALTFLRACIYLSGWITGMAVTRVSRQTLPADKKYVFGYHPHALFPTGKF